MTPEKADPHSQAADAVHDGRPVDAQLVRGARPGRRILWILICSAGAAAVLLLGMFLLSNGGFAGQNGNSGRQSVDSQAFSSDAPPAADAPTTATGAPQPVPTGEAPNVNAPTVPSSTAPAP
jgi:hypothetical protein